MIVQKNRLWATVATAALGASFSSGLAGPAAAQSAAAANAAGPTVTEEVVVTASRITHAGFAAPTPVTVIGADTIKQKAATGIAEVLNDIPGFVAQTSPTTQRVNVGNTGASTADLRGLNSNRTLVLVDGHRFVPSTVVGTYQPGGSVDLNLIPTSIIERVDVVTGGASASWGSDAVAGVVNIVLNKKLTGSHMQVQYGQTQSGDGQEYLGSYAYGRDFGAGRGHFVVAGEYVNDKGTGDCNARPGRCDSLATTVTNPTPGLNGYPANVLVGNGRLAVATVNGLINSGPLKGTLFNAGGQTTSTIVNGFYLGSGLSMSGGGPDGANLFNEHIPIEVPNTHYSLYGHANYALTDSINATMDLSYGRGGGQSTSIQPRYTATSGASSISIKNDNPYLPASVVAAMAAAKVTSFTLGLIGEAYGPIQANNDRITTRADFGLDGGFKVGGHDFRWNGYYQYGETHYYQSAANNLYLANFALAVDTVRNAGGQIVCRSGASGCAPIDPFGGLPASAAATAFAFPTTWGLVDLKEHVVAGNVQTDLFSLPAGPVTLAAGLEYRADSASGSTDPLSQINGAFSAGAAATAVGSVNAKEGYAEVAAPLLKDLPLVQALNFNAAYRYTDYSTSGGVGSWKYGGTWDVVDWLRVRATQSRDIRAPNLFDLYSTQQTIFQVVNDPATKNSIQVPALFGGTTTLKPELADTFTSGVVLQPKRFGLAGLRVSLDYYSIDLKGAITALGAQNIVTGCFNGATALCTRITRGANGALTSVNNTNVNVNEIQDRGEDIEAQYRLQLSRFNDKAPGALSLRVLATHVDTLATIDFTGTKIDRAGQTSGSGGGSALVEPHWKVNTNVTYDVGRFSGTVTLRFIGKGIIDPTLVGPDSAGYSPTLTNSVSLNTIPAVAYFDLASSYTLLERGDRQIQIYGAIQNLLDKSPPFDFNPAFYDTLGRMYRVGLRMTY